MYNQQVNLPFNPFALQHQPMQFQQDSPPILPNIPGINPKIAYILKNVVAEVLNEIGRKCQANTLRTFHFNQIYNNNFNNNDFFQLIASTMDMIELMLVQNQAQYPEQAMQAVVPQSVLFSCVLNLQNPNFRQQLASNCDQRVIYEAEQLFQQIGIMQNAIMAYKQSITNTMQSPAFINHSPVQYQNQGWQNPVAQQVQQNQYNNPPQNTGRFPSAAMPVNNQHLQNNSATQKTYVQRPFQPPAPPAQQQYQSNAFSYQEKAKAVEVSIYQNNQHQQPVQIIQVKDNDDGFDEVTRWIPSEEFPYPPAVNKNEKLRSRTTMRTKVLDDGTLAEYPFTEMIVQPRSKEDMDRDQHSIVTSAQMAVTSFIPAAFSTRAEAVDNALSNTIIKKSKESSKLTDEVIEKDSWTSEMFIEESIFENKAAQVAESTEDSCVSYRSKHIIAKPFISKRDNSDILKHLSNAKTISDLCKKMQGLLTGKTNKQIVQFVNELDKYLTVEFVKYLGAKFGIYVKRLDSFMDDCQDIYDFILNESTEAHLSGFKEQEIIFINTYLSAMVGEELKAQLKKECEIIDENGKVAVFVTFVESFYSITTIDIHSTELGVEFYKATEDEGKGRSSLIRQSSNPALFKFAKDLIAASIEDDFLFAHHLLITNDNVVFEISKGVVGFQENYLINEYVM